MEDIPRSNGPFGTPEEYYADLKDYSRRTGIPPDIIDAIQQMNSATELVRAGRQSDDWHPVNLGNERGDIKESLWDIINLGETLKLISPGQTVLDMGSGNGSSSLIWAYRGYNVIGIEIDPQLVKLSRQFIRKYQSLLTKGVSIRVLQGSYFTKDYLDYRDQPSPARLLEAKHRFGDFRPVCQDSIYAKSKTSLSTFDIWYAYPWSDEEPSICEFFSRSAKRDSVLCLARSLLPKDELKLLGLEKYPLKEAGYMPFFRRHAERE